VKVFDSDDGGDDEWAEKETATGSTGENNANPQRDAWMREPAASDVDYVQRKRPRSPPGQFVAAQDSHQFKPTENQVNQHLADLQNDFDSDVEGVSSEVVKDEPAQHHVNYTFGDSGSSWRMTKLKGVYRRAEESGMILDDVAEESYGDLRLFDEAREEEREVDRRKMYGKHYVCKEKPSGELFQERKRVSELRRETEARERAVANTAKGESLREVDAPLKTAPLDQSALNRLKAQ
jgi:hypothetical protein